jgi:hypothetical protein
VPPTITQSVDAYQADGDGYYDIQFMFDLAPPIERFTGGDFVNYTITGIGSLTATSFKVLSLPAEGMGSGPFVAAAHLQGLPIGGEGSDGSGWVTDITGGSEIPEPSSLVLLALGACGLLGHRVWRRRRG